MIRMYDESSRKFDSNNAIYEYIHGGRGIVKLEAPSGTHHFYMFTKPLEKDEFPDDVLFVYAVHDRAKKFYIGMIENDAFRLTKHSRFLPDTDIVKGAVYIVRMAMDPSLVKTTPMSLYHMGMCARCGRQLTNDKSIEIGFGAKCRKRLENG